MHLVRKGRVAVGASIVGTLRFQADKVSIFRHHSTTTPSPRTTQPKMHTLSENKADASAYAFGDDLANYSSLRHNFYLLLHGRRMWLPLVMLGIYNVLAPLYLTTWITNALYWSGCILLQRYSVRGRMNRLRKDFTDHVCVVTGGTSGIGLYTAMQLWEMGAHVVVASRPGKETETREFIRKNCRLPKESEEDTPLERLTFVSVDLSDQLEVMAAAARIKGMFDNRVDLLVNSAAVWREVPNATRQGLEEHIATNFLGPFHLTEALLPSLRRSRRGGRIVYVTCASHNGVRRADVVRERMTLKPSEDTQQLTARCYSASKLGNIYHVQSLAARRYEGIPLNTPSADLRPVDVCAVDPGFCATGHTWRESPPFLGTGLLGRALRSLWMKDGYEGSQTVVNCCVREDLESGGFYAACMCMPSGLSRRAHDSKSCREVMQWAMAKAIARYYTVRPRADNKGDTSNSVSNNLSKVSSAN
ncbi:short-chain dehydrogenase, putative [Trypanosoma brucei gambiense DAL972]|uniref:Short-chain dehydrogenase, putative n=1 Tax=Trypanosoma brucei gambiense (strain MHOM/CI/86/DAL972) TaxID=679716 RepID=C9ZWC0_TRYB9|nr:short-chain dehydrogenase, putative [Trypanosoma brucei gambiense DAL972]CBH13709.1 short-chain dehydrogenase, putative [Trypanosoma brucei gambiense DAL972]|eukprot:XP_011775985.1 short-chain dehydrogenase, putative [Trypanosoma brucei gambiense DAL972]